MSTICYELDTESKNKLMEIFPPKYPMVKYDHITISMGGIDAKLPEPAESVEVVGIADDGNGLEALIVRVNGMAVRPIDQKPWHITASFDPSKNAPAAFDIFAKSGLEKEKPYKPVTSNGLLANVLDDKGQPKNIDNPNWKVMMFDEPIQIKTHPKVQFSVMELSKLAGNVVSK
ncbi:MAG: hypothetical protein NC218_00565 [Acetobacter sp.]|nr:hypothetical protein [Acetobacter sp.]